MSIGKFKVKKDQMTSMERMTAFAKGEEIDRIPCSISTGETMASFIGMNTREYYHSPEGMVELELGLYKKIGADGVRVSTTLRGVGEAMGSKLHYPNNNLQLLETPAINHVKDIVNLEPSNPEKDGRLPIVLKALKMLKKEIENKSRVGLGLTGPFSTAASVVGTENLLKWMIKYPEDVHILMEIVTESNNKLIVKAAELGAGVGFSDPVSSTSLISAKQFNVFSAPYLKRNVEKVIELTGSSPSIHICGNSKGIWESVMDTGISSFSIDNIEDLGEAKKLMGDRITISGNVPPVDVIRLGTKEDVLKAAKTCIRKAYDSKNGFILSAGCQIPMDTPLENIQGLVDAARIYGSYPINKELLFGDE